MPDPDDSPSNGHRPGVRLVVLSGEQDRSTVTELSQTLAKAISFGDPEVVVDMSGVEFIDAATIRVIVRADRYLQRRSRALTIGSPSRCVRRLLRLCGLDDLIESPERLRSATWAGALATWVAVPASPPVAPRPSYETEPLGVSVSELLRSVDTSTLS